MSQYFPLTVTGSTFVKVQPLLLPGQPPLVLESLLNVAGRLQLLPLPPSSLAKIRTGTFCATA